MILIFLLERVSNFIKLVHTITLRKTRNQDILVDKILLFLIQVHKNVLHGLVKLNLLSFHVGFDVASLCDENLEIHVLLL